MKTDAKMQRPRHVALMSVIIWTMAPSLAFGAQTKLECPPELPATSLTMHQAPKGWTAYSPAALPLRSAGFMNGPPALLADLKPDSVIEGPRQSVETWKFDAGFYPQGLWIVCGYGRGDEMTLSRKIEHRPSTCSIKYRKGSPAGKAGTGDIAIECH